MTELSGAGREYLKSLIAQNAPTKKCEKWDVDFAIEDLTNAREKLIMRYDLPCDSQFGVPANKTAELYRAMRNLIFPAEAAKLHERFVFCMICHGRIENNDGNSINADRHYRSHNLPSVSAASQTSDSPKGVKRHALNHWDHASSAKKPRQAQSVVQKVGQEQFEEDIVVALILDLQPWSRVDSPGFRFLNALYMPYFLRHSTTFTRTRVPDFVDKLRSMLRSVFSIAPFVSLSADGWTSSTMDHCLGITCHFVNQRFEVQSSILKFMFCSISEAVDVGPVIRSTIADFGLQNKVVAVTTGNATAMINAVTQANLTHLSCFVHTLHLAVEDALTGDVQVAKLLGSVRKTVSFFKSSYVRKGQLSDLLQTEASIRALVASVETRWNSSYDMLEQYLLNRDDVDAVLKINDRANLCLDEGSVLLASELVTHLKRFRDLTEHFYSSSDIRASQVILRVLDFLRSQGGSVQADHVNAHAPVSAECKNDGAITEPEEVVRLSTAQARKVSVSFKTLLNDALTRRLLPLLSNPTLLKACFLDPETHYQFHKAFLVPHPQVFGMSVVQSDSLYERAQYLVAEELRQMWLSANGSNPPTQAQLQTAQMLATTTVRRFSEDIVLRMMLQPAAAPTTAHDYFSSHGHSGITCMRELILLARKYLCVMSASVSVEREFSLSGLVLNDLRTRLGSDVAESQIFGKYNIRLYPDGDAITENGEATSRWGLKVCWDQPVLPRDGAPRVRVEYHCFKD
jgi:hypothetical protein